MSAPLPIRLVTPSLPYLGRAVGRSVAAERPELRAVDASAGAELRLRQAYVRHMPRRADLHPRLEGVIADVLDHPGSLVRARLIHSLGRRRGLDEERALKLAVGTEYFHTASLVFDDLPAMDDAETRRGQTCPHLNHGEAAAMLGALAFVNRGYALLWSCLTDLPLERRLRAAELVEACLGVDGILDGQCRDLHFGDRGQIGVPDPAVSDPAVTDPAVTDPAEVLAVAEGKTVSLIRLTLLLPAIVTGAEARDEVALEELSKAWGLAYQILDDFKDLLMSGEESGKSARRDDALGRPNYPTAAGQDKAWRHVDHLLRAARSELDGLLVRSADWSPLERVQNLLEEDRERLARRRETR